MPLRGAFLRSEFRTLSFLGASQHVAIYAADASEGDREAFRATLHARLESFERPYADAEIPENDHVGNIACFADELSRRFAGTAKEGRFLVGPAQKALNLYLKYLWCAGWIRRPPHCPVDAIVLREAGEAGIRWSKMGTVGEYRDAIAVLRKAAGGLPLAEWELEAWRNGKAKAMRGNPSRT